MTAAVALHAAEREPFVGEKSAWRGYRAEGSSLLLEVDVSKLLLCAVDHDKAGVEFFDRPWWWEATRLRHTLALPPRDQLASRQLVAGSSRSSAPSCNRAGSRSPSIARPNTERASSSGFTVLLPTDLSVRHASSKAFSISTRL